LFGKSPFKHKTTRYARNLEGMTPWHPTGYAYGVMSNEEQAWSNFRHCL